MFDAHGMPVNKMETIVNWDVSSAEKGGYAHFMIKGDHGAAAAGAFRDHLAAH